MFAQRMSSTRHSKFFRHTWQVNFWKLSLPNFGKEERWMAHSKPVSWHLNSAGSPWRASRKVFFMKGTYITQPWRPKLKQTSYRVRVLQLCMTLLPYLLLKWFVGLMCAGLESQRLAGRLEHLGIQTNPVLVTAPKPVRLLHKAFLFICFEKKKIELAFWKFHFVVVTWINTRFQTVHGTPILH